nr:immunoglobulin heavy chain junction region [Macaca mulatta]MOV90999.1 immunoglobulin heavy chain junction region [Macaca mulatta]MOV91086.1 immunoglobulin heavy chain junction region [Macaca mulatta]
CVRMTTAATMYNYGLDFW